MLLGIFSIPSIFVLLSFLHEQRCKFFLINGKGYSLWCAKHLIISDLVIDECPWFCKNHLLKFYIAVLNSPLQLSMCSFTSVTPTQWNMKWCCSILVTVFAPLLKCWASSTILLIRFASPSMRLSYPIYFGSQSVRNRISVLFSRGISSYTIIQKVMIYKPMYKLPNISRPILLI